ncbi:MAG: hypothetical protein AAGK79_13330 [Pseudomonadota bacterium]
MALAAVLMAFGVSRGHWVAPALILLGLIAMRAIMWGLPGDFQEVVAGALWILLAALLCYHKWWLAGFLVCMSGLTYPVLLIFGQRIITMGLAPIVADAFLILSLIVVGGGVFGLGNLDSLPRDRAGLGAGPVACTQGRTSRH